MPRCVPNYNVTATAASREVGVEVFVPFAYYYCHYWILETFLHPRNPTCIVCHLRRRRRRLELKVCGISDFFQIKFEFAARWCHQLYPSCRAIRIRLSFIKNVELLDLVGVYWKTKPPTTRGAYINIKSKLPIIICLSMWWVCLINFDLYCGIRSISL